MENKGALDSKTSLNLSGFINSMCGIGEENETTLSTSSSCVSSNNYCLVSTISSSSYTCKSETSTVALRIGCSTLMSFVCDISELLVSFWDALISSWIIFLKFSTCCSKWDHHAGLSVRLETEWTFTLFSSNCAIGWLFRCLKLSFRSWEWPQEDWGRYFARNYCGKYSSWSFAFMSSHLVIAGSCLTKRIYSRFSQKSWALPINFLFANLTLVAYEKFLQSKNCSISFNHLTKTHGLSSLWPSKSGTSKSVMIQENSVSTKNFKKNLNCCCLTHVLCTEDVVGA